MKVFLGGTVNKSTWRNYLISRLQIAYFNPVVDDWNEQAAERELLERQQCDFCLYVLTPRMEGLYSIAEVADDSFRKADRTLFCYLTNDDEYAFTLAQIAELERLGKLVQQNGAVWKRSLDEVAEFLNSAAELASDRLLQNTSEIKNCFISYGRRHSLAFAHRLYQHLTRRGLQTWFDMNDIPLGVDFQQQIDEGIRRADNFIYIMSPHSINSVYCDKELELALKYKKRIIPILHVEPQDKATWDKIHPEIQKRNWIYFRQNHDRALELSARAMSIKAAINDAPEADWHMTDGFDRSAEGLLSLVDSHRAYVRTHTVLLDKALDWHKRQRTTEYLLVGNERADAEAWMQRSHQVFKNPTGHLIQPPCRPTDMVAQYIMESKKNGNNMQCDVFVCHAADNRPMVDKVIAALHRHGFSTWLHDNDIRKGSDYEVAIRDGIEQSATMLFFVSEKSLQSDYCRKEYAYALRYNKRIIPLLLSQSSDLQSSSTIEASFNNLSKLQYIDFTNLTDEIKVQVLDRSDVQADVEARHQKTPFELSTDELINALNDNRSYYEQHRMFLVQALRWHEGGNKHAHLLRGFNLDNALTWLRLNQSRTLQAPTVEQIAFIEASEAAKGQLGTEVFISYSRKDGDFARRLNEQLQRAGKTTWFDQESISKGVDFEKEIYKGIDGCDNFVFVISPDAVASEYCEREVTYAAQQHKRIITLLWRDTDVATMPQTLSRVNWIDFKNEPFGKSFAQLVQEIETDREYAHAHTVWQQRAQEWNANECSADYLLNASACNNAEAWLEEAGISVQTRHALSHQNTNSLSNKETRHALSLQNQNQHPTKSPAPTTLQMQFVQASRAAINAAVALEQKKRRRLKIIMITAICVAFIAIGMGIWALSTYSQLNTAQFTINFGEGKTLRNAFKYEQGAASFKRAKKFGKNDSIDTYIKECDSLTDIRSEYDTIVNRGEQEAIKGGRFLYNAALLYLKADSLKVGSEARQKMLGIRPLMNNELIKYNFAAQQFFKAKEMAIANDIRKTIAQWETLLVVVDSTIYRQ